MMPLILRFFFDFSSFLFAIVSAIDASFHYFFAITLLLIFSLFLHFS